MTLVEDYERGLSLRSIAVSTGRSRHAIKAELARAGVTPRGALVQRHLNTAAADVKLSASLQELIDGLMLGDGGIEIRPGRAPRLNMTNKHLDYVEYVAERLRSHGVTPYVGRCGRGHWRVLSHAWVALQPVAALWYEGTRKRTVPRDLTLTPESLMHWWLGDGGLAKHYGKRPTGYLYTNSFHRSHVEHLSTLLRGMHIPTTVNRCGRPQQHEWRIHLGRRGVQELLTRIGPCPVPSYDYKWNVQEVHR